MGNRAKDWQDIGLTSKRRKLWNNFKRIFKCLFRYLYTSLTIATEATASLCSLFAGCGQLVCRLLSGWMQLMVLRMGLGFGLARGFLSLFHDDYVWALQAQAAFNLDQYGMGQSPSLGSYSSVLNGTRAEASTSSKTWKWVCFSVQWLDSWIVGSLDGSTHEWIDRCMTKRSRQHSSLLK